MRSPYTSANNIIIISHVPLLFTPIFTHTSSRSASVSSFPSTQASDRKLAGKTPWPFESFSHIPNLFGFLDFHNKLLRADFYVTQFIQNPLHTVTLSSKNLK